jgi:hypothetical protein
MKGLIPIGFSDFREIIERGFRYIDKTRYVHTLCSTGKYYFLSRPRRFGKSLHISLIKELYSGSKSLFEGLWIYDQWDWGKIHPVIHLSLKSLNYKILGLDQSLVQKLMEIAGDRGLILTGKYAKDVFYDLIKKLSAENKIVVLIDEYDAPILDFLGDNLAKSIENRNILKEFYSILKETDAHLEFVMLTGVSRFSKVGIFSGLNNLWDISAEKSFSSMLGYTQSELEDNFKREIEECQEELKKTRPSLLADLKKWYNGYRFHEAAETVYNPVSVNLFFKSKEFNNYWFETGTPTFLIQLLKEKGLYNLENQKKTELDFISYDLEDLRIFGLLYQTGYLTIQSRLENGLYILDYPNYEVKKTMLLYLMEAYTSKEMAPSGLELAINMEESFQRGSISEVMENLKVLFQSIPYQLVSPSTEKFYHAAIHLIFTQMGLRIQSEVCTSNGRIDSVIEMSDTIYIFEFKLDISAKQALDQIRQKEYFMPYKLRNKKVIGVGIHLSSSLRNIKEWEEEEIWRN